MAEATAGVATGATAEVTEDGADMPGTVATASPTEECFYGEVNYASVLQWNGVLYGGDTDSDVSGLSRGKAIDQTS